MLRRARTYWSSGAIIGPAKCHSTRCAGASFLIGAMPHGGRKPINAKCETVHTLATFRDAYRFRRCVIPVDGFFEWMAIKGAKSSKQPFAIAMKDGKPFGMGGIWENWRDPASGEWVRTFA